jgi:hypothetical protein
MAFRIDGKSSLQPHHEQSINVPQPHEPLALAAQDNQLLAQHLIFSLEYRSYFTLEQTVSRTRSLRVQ